MQIKGTRGIAEKLMSWHGGQGDALYAVGSNWYSGHSVDSAVVERAISNLEGIHGRTAAHRRQLAYLVRALKGRLRERPKRARAKGPFDIEARIAEARKVRKNVSPEFHPLFDHLLSLARNSAKHGHMQGAGREISQAKRLATKYPAARDRKRSARKRRLGRRR